MLFSSTLFLFLFLPIIFCLYFAVPFKFKNIILLVFSLIFYAWGEPVYVFLMIFSSLTDFICGKKVYENPQKGKPWVILSAIVNLSVLGFFKYSDFFIGIVNSVLGTSIPLLNLPLPLGISFYTFQTMSYTLDIYRGEAKPQKSLASFIAYVSLFPQLIAGPIIRYQDVDEQLRYREHTWDKFSAGVNRFLVGLGKKVIIANNVGFIFTQISQQAEMSMATAWLGILSYALQIYFDFSGYSDMAIGLGKMFGFDFLENFNYPYISKSITEFWRRWHMSLGTWFRDYVYIPLGGNRCSKGRQILNICIVWFLTGFWHGANWNFIIWGCYFGGFLLLEKFVLSKFLKKSPAIIQHIYTLVIVAVGWAIFAIEDFGALTTYLGNMFLNTNFVDSYFVDMLTNNIGFLVLGCFFAIPHKKINKWTWPLIPIFILAIAYLVSGSFNPFLYFRF